jgi:flagellar protein FlaG
VEIAMSIELSLSTHTTSTRQQGIEYAKFSESYSQLLAKEKQGETVSIADEQTVKKIEHAIKLLQGPQTSLEIAIHEKTHDIMVKVLNRETGELIREIPPEKTLDLVAKMMEIAGIIIDEKI